MLKKLALLRHAWHPLGAIAIVLLGFWLFPENPGLPAALLLAVAVPLALLLALVATLLRIRERVREREADAYYEYRPVEYDLPEDD